MRKFSFTFWVKSSTKEEMESVGPCVFLFLFFFYCTTAVPVTKIQNDNSTQMDVESFNDTNTNGTAKDLYVIRTVIYEVGILTDADNDTNSSESHEQVDLTFYDPKRNGSFIDLNNIPIPYQTNVSGQVITGIAPANFGRISLNSSNFKENGSEVSGQFPLKAPIYPNVLISQINNISTTNPQRERSILDDLPDELMI